MKTKSATPPTGQTGESSLRLILDSAPVGLIQLDEERRYLWANAAYLKFIGYRFEELREMTMFQVTHPADLPLTKMIADSFREPGYFLRRLEKRYVRKDGEVVWGMVTSQQVMNPETGQMNLFTVVEDITELKRREMNLQRAEAEIDRLLSLSLDLMCVYDLDERIKRVNIAVLNVLGYEEKDLVGHYVLDFIHPDDHHRTRQEIERLREGVPSVKFENRCRMKSGAYRLISWNSVPDPHTGSVLATGRDITDKKLDEIRLAYSAKMASLGEMAGGIAHEVNNPLAIILGKVTNIQALLRHSAPNLEQMQDELASIERTGQRIAKIIRGLRAFSRNAEADPMTHFYFRRVVDDTLELCAERLRNRNIQLFVDCPSHLGVRGRQSQLCQVLMNLISNSYDAVEHERNPWIRIEVERHLDLVRLRVQDSGAGIDYRVVEKMMQPFFTTKEVGRGTGLGLSISKGIVEEHGGQLRYEERNGNTCFVVDIPAFDL